jgi:hypothetical protein
MRGQLNAEVGQVNATRPDMTMIWASETHSYHVNIFCVLSSGVVLVGVYVHHGFVHPACLLCCNWLSCVTLDEVYTTTTTLGPYLGSYLVCLAIC